jgi:hypothetical protein
LIAQAQVDAKVDSQAKALLGSSSMEFALQNNILGKELVKHVKKQQAASRFPA